MHKYYSLSRRQRVPIYNLEKDNFTKLWNEFGTYQIFFFIFMSYKTDRRKKEKKILRESGKEGREKRMKGRKKCLKSEVFFSFQPTINYNLSKTK